jgi:acyl-CoA reductase-like NAD-dependent aldehyde dehydrogenase
MCLGNRILRRSRKNLSTDEVVNTDARKSIIAFQPVGVIGSIMPWNFPYWQGLRFAAPSLMIGNTIILKPASVTMQCGIEIEKTFDKAGIPQGVFQTVVGDSKFGLGASIWSQDLEKAERLSSMVESGIVTVTSVVVSDPRVPFGGIKNSGFGLELSRYGMLEFVNIKSVRFYDQLIHDHHVE